MSDRPKLSTRPSISTRGWNVGGLAARALCEVAARTTRPKSTVTLALVERLTHAAMGRSDESYRTVARRMMTMGVAPETIADDYIPIVARKMGEEWSSDAASFAQVTIGSARLQALLRELSTCWAADRADGAASSAAAVVIVPQHTHHTLGASLLSTQLRRIGLSVRLCVGMDPRALKVTLDNGKFDAVIISASSGDRLDAVRMLVDIARSSGAQGGPPIVLGGTIMETQGDVRRATGADLATVNLLEAMDFCRLPVSGILH